MRYLALALILVSGFSLRASENDKDIETITLGAGCFWCVEAIFEELEGVQSVESGYMGGETSNPSYKAVCSGLTGHAEVVQVKYDAEVISLQEILEVFFAVHDPTTLNRQGADVGSQYRSAIFYETDEQKEIAIAIKRQLNTAKIWDDPIVTVLSQATEFYVAENYHQDYYALNGTNPYCNAVITPKMEKFKKAFSDQLKVR